VVGDRGVGTAANDQALEALGIKRVGLQRNGTPGRARLAAARLAGRDRGRISHLKGGFGRRRTPLRRLGAART
jgi:transposase, IS5 family